MAKYVMIAMAEEDVFSGIDFAFVEIDDELKKFVKFVLESLGDLTARGDFLRVDFREFSPVFFSKLPAPLRQYEDALWDERWVELTDDAEPPEAVRIDYCTIHIEDDRILWSARAKHSNHEVETEPLHFKDIGWNELVKNKS